MIQKPISTRLHRFSLALNHARKTRNGGKTTYLENLIRIEKDEVALFVKEEKEWNEEEENNLSNL